MWLVEKLLERGLRGLIEQAGPAVEAAFVLIVGLLLAVVGPWWLARENHKRAAAGHKPRYARIELGIILIGGAVFTAFGLYLLLSLGE